MDLIHNLLNIVLPLISLVTILVSVPPYMIYKLFKYFKKAASAPENLAGKVVIITGASSGNGEQIAYEYARRGARLSLAARREDRLRAVAAKATEIGSPDVIVIRADVSKIEDCKRLIEDTVSHFGQLDHLVSNAGVSHIKLFEDCTEFSTLHSLMDINFWGSVYCSKFAIPHLRNSKGKIVVVCSAAIWLATPRFNLYNASKAAQFSFFESLKAEFGSDIGITIATPGVFDSEMTDHQFWSKSKIKGFPSGSAEKGARKIVETACRGETYVTTPYWNIVVYWFKVVFPQLVIKSFHFWLVNNPFTNSNKDA